MPDGLFPDKPIKRITHKRPRNEMWDAVEAAIYPDGRAPTSRTGRIKALVKDLNDLGATPAEFTKRYARYKEQMTIDLWKKPENVINHWTALGEPTPAEKAKTAQRAKDEKERGWWLDRREEVRAAVPANVKRCKGKGHEPMTEPGTCQSCSNLLAWRQNYGVESG